MGGGPGMQPHWMVGGGGFLSLVLFGGLGILAASVFLPPRPRQGGTRGRATQVRSYLRIASDILGDVGDAAMAREASARAFIPLVAQARKRGEALLARRTLWSVVCHPGPEGRLGPVIQDLSGLEARLRRLPPLDPVDGLGGG